MPHVLPEVWLFFRLRSRMQFLFFRQRALRFWTLRQRRYRTHYLCRLIPLAVPLARPPQKASQRFAQLELYPHFLRSRNAGFRCLGSPLPWSPCQFQCQIKLRPLRLFHLRPCASLRLYRTTCPYRPLVKLLLLA